MKSTMNIIRTLAPQDLQRLLNSPDAKASSGLRDRAILQLLIGAGITMNELPTLRAGDFIKEENSVVWLYHKNTRLKLGREVVRWVGKWMQCVGGGEKMGRAEPLLVNISPSAQRHSPMTAQQIRRRVRQYLKEIGACSHSS